MKFPQPRGYKKENMLYPDRCMKKWHGFILSDHGESMHGNLLLQPFQDEEKDFIVKESYCNNKLIDIISKGKKLTGYIVNIKDESLILKTETDLVKIKIDEANELSFADF